MTGDAAGAWLGLLSSLGICLVVIRLPPARRRLDDRVVPFLHDVLPAAPATRPGVRRPRGADDLRVVADGLVRAAAARLDGLLGGRVAVTARLDALGTGTLERLRVEQVLWCGAAVGAVLGAGLLRAATGSRPEPVTLLLLAVAAGTAGVVARDRRLSGDVQRRRERIRSELPTVAELVALAVAAGEGPVGALQRVARLCPGALGHELGRVLADIRAGTPVAAALRTLAARHDLVVLRRFVDGIVVALERGTPLAQVLRAQAVDAREQSRRDLVEAAARREVAMVLPVVLLVLPVSVVFALFPGFYGLSLGG